MVKRRKVQKSTAAKEDVEGGADASGQGPVGETGASDAQQSKKNKAAAPEAPDEDADRKKSLQRDIQKLVVKLRADGKTESEIKLAKRDLQLKQGLVRELSGRKREKLQQWKERTATKKAEATAATTAEEDARKAERAEKLAHKHELVVIPIMWRGRHDQPEVLRAAEDIKACVAQQGVDVWLDSRRHYTPGQKFAHWEHRGVMLRVEVGPEDIQKGICRVCRASEPGDYKTVERKSIPLPPAGARRLLLALKDWGLSKIEVEGRADDENDEKDDDAGSTQQGASSAQKVVAKADEHAVEGNWAPHASTLTKSSKDKQVGKKRKRLQ